MDLQVAIFLLIFLSISSLATLGICFVEIRSCWRNYKMRKSHRDRGCLEELSFLEETGLQTAGHDMQDMLAYQDDFLYPNNPDDSSNSAMAAAAAADLIAAEAEHLLHPHVSLHNGGLPGGGGGGGGGGGHLQHAQLRNGGGPARAGVEHQLLQQPMNMLPPPHLNHVNHARPPPPLDPSRDKIRNHIIYGGSRQLPMHDVGAPI